MIQHTTILRLAVFYFEADEKGLSGLWFDEEKSDARCLPPEHRKGTLPVLDKTKRWLDIYFAGHAPGFYAATAHNRLIISDGRLGYPPGNPLWRNDHLRCHRQKNCKSEKS